MEMMTWTILSFCLLSNESGKARLDAVEEEVRASRAAVAPVEEAAPAPVSAPQIWAFMADWCVPCQKMKPVLKDLREQGVAIEEFNIDQQPGLAERFEITSLPTFLLMRGEQELGRISGITSLPLLKARLEHASRLPANGPQMMRERMTPRGRPVPQYRPAPQFEREQRDQQQHARETHEIPGADHVISLTRATFRCEAKQAEELGDFLKKQLPDRLEIQVEEDRLTVTGLREDLVRVGGFVELLKAAKAEEPVNAEKTTDDPIFSIRITR